MNTMFGKIGGLWDRTRNLPAVAAVVLMASLPFSSGLFANSAELIGTIPNLKGGINSLEFDMSGQLLMTGADNGQVRLWDLNGERGVDSILRSGRRVSKAVYAKDGDFIVIADANRGIEIVDGVKGRRIRQLDGLNVPQISLAISPNDQLVAAGSAENTLTIWRADHEKPIHLIEAHMGPITDIAFSPDSEFLTTVGHDGMMNVWEVATGYLAHSYQLNMPLYAVEYSPTGQEVALGGELVRILKVKTGEIMHTMREHKDLVTALSFSPNGKFLATGSHDKTANIFSTTTGRKIESIASQDGLITSIAFSDDGLALATGSETYLPVEGRKIGENTVAIWDMTELYSDGRISRFVERELYHWQKKGEFEKLSDYERRLNKVDVQAGKVFAKAFRRYGDDVREGAQVSAYDPESEQFVVTLPAIGDFVVNVPLDKAKMFKKRFHEVVYRNFVVEPSLKVPHQSTWNLKKVELYLPAAKQSFFYSRPN